MKYPFKLITVLLVLSLFGCNRMIVKKPTEINGYRMFPVPNGNYKVGQVLQVFVRPKYKVDIFHNTKLNEDDYLSSKAIELTSTEIQKFNAHITANVMKQLDGKIEHDALKNIELKVTNTMVINGIQTSIYNRIMEDLKTKPETVSYFKRLIERERRFDVTTSILFGDISLSVKNNNSTEAELNLDFVKKSINSAIGGNTSNDGSSDMIGKQLAIGYNSDASLINDLIAALN